MFGFLKKSDKDQDATPATAAAVAPVPEPLDKPLSWRERLFAGLSRTRSQLGGKLKSVFARGKVDDELLEELETLLLTSDVGMDATMHLLDELKRRAKQDKLEGAAAIQQALADTLAQMLAPLEAPLQVDSHKPFVIMIAGVNGAGKTTSIGKLAKYFQGQGKSVLLAAGDTFRAAAIDQLRIWGERIGAEVIRHREGADPSAVIFDAIQAARARGVHYVLADTAGRLHTRSNLMQELKKVSRVAATALGRPPDETLLVLDATTGQNAIEQARQFSEVAGLSGLVLAKLDGTARGGIVLTIAQEFHLPIKLVGTGERVDAIEPFEANAFLDALLA